MKYVSGILFLIFAVSTAHAQVCPDAGTLPGMSDLAPAYIKHNPGNATPLAAHNLSDVQPIGCIAGESSPAPAHINAAAPFSSSVEELWQGSEWSNNSMQENEYNEDNQLLSKIFLRWYPALQSFKEETATYYTYDADGYTAEVLTQTWTGTTFENQYRSVSERDAFGNQVLLERFDWVDGEWKTRFLSTSTVVDGRISETTIQTTHALGILANAILLTFEYDSEGRKTLELQEGWDEATQSWEPEFRDLTSYSDTGVITMTQTFNGDWVDFIETTEVFDSNGLAIEWVSVSQTTSVGGNRFLYQYDNAGNLTELISQGQDGMGGWINQSRSTSNLDPDGDPLEHLYQMYNSDNMMWENVSRVTFNYDETEQATHVEKDMIPGLASFDIYPYPATDKVNIALQLTQPVQLQVEIFDMLGRRVNHLVEGTVTAGMQHLSWIPQNEPAGLYFVRFSVDGVVDSRPLVLVK